MYEWLGIGDKIFHCWIKIGAIVRTVISCIASTLAQSIHHAREFLEVVDTPTENPCRFSIKRHYDASSIFMLPPSSDTLVHPSSNFLCHASNISKSSQFIVSPTHP